MLLRIISIIRYHLITAAQADVPFDSSLTDSPLLKTQVKAVKFCGSFIKYIDDPPPTIQLQAVEEEPFSIYYIKNPCEKAQIEAIKQKLHYFDYIKSPTEKVKKLFLDKKNALTNKPWL